MSIPNLPTDNLYKFLSISGIFIIILSLSSLYFNSKTLNTEIIETNRKIRHYGYKIEDWICESEQLEYIFQIEKELTNDIDSIKQRTKFDTLNNCSKKTTALVFEYFKSKFPNDNGLKSYLDLEINHMNNHKKVDSLEIDIEYEIKLVDYKILLLKRNRIFSISGILIGFLCSIVGFIFWYNKSQKFLDLKLKKEA